MQSAKPSHLNLNQRGVSLVEALVVSAMIASTVVMVTQFSSTFPVRNVSLNRSCETYAQAIVNAVQEETYYREVFNYIPTGTSNRTASSFYGAASRAIGADTNWWTSAPADYLIATESAGQPVPLQNFQLINGSIRTLSSIYNNNSGLRCTTYGAYAPLTDPAGTGGIAKPADLSRDDVNAQAQIRIRPYNRLSNVDDCVSNLHIAPEGANETNTLMSAFSPGSADVPLPAGREEHTAASPPLTPSSLAIASRGVGRADLGVELSVQVNYTQNGQNQTCNVSQKFEYPSDRTPPPAPTITVTQNTSNPESICAPTASGNTRVVIRSTGTNERGTQFLCRDLSWKKVYNSHPPSSYYSNVCVNPTTGVVAGINNGAPSSEDFGDRQQNWVPCDQLIQCGIAPSTATYNKPNKNQDETGHEFELSYPSLPAGCVMNIEAVAVDSAGNTSIAGLSTNRAILETATTVGIDPNNEIHSGNCGTAGSPDQFCSSGMANYATSPYYTTFPDGYYTCRATGCCVGPGCSPYTP